MSVQTTAGAKPAQTPKEEKKRPGAVNKSVKNNDNSKSSGKAERRKKGMTPGLAALITIVITLSLMLAGFLLLFFNLFALKDVTVAFLQQGSSPYQEQIDALAGKQIDLDEWAADLTNKEDELKKRDAVILKKESELVAREGQLKAWDGELVSLEETLSGKQAQLSQLVSIFERMDAATASRILSSMPNMDDQMAILLKMKQTTCSSILAAMDPTLAAQLASNMLAYRQPDYQENGNQENGN